MANRWFHLLMLGAIVVGPCAAQDAVVPSPTIVVSAPWLRATPKGGDVVGGYLTITNNGPQPDRLLGASLAVAERGEVHTMRMADGVMQMRRLDDGLPIAPGATVALAPGGNHLMFERPTRQLREGEAVSGTLDFAHAGKIPLTFVVAGIAAKTAPSPVSVSPGAGLPTAGASR